MSVFLWLGRWGGRTTHIGVDFAVADGEGALLVQQHATVARALVAVLLFLRTARNRDVGLGIAATRETDKTSVSTQCLMMDRIILLSLRL